MRVTTGKTSKVFRVLTIGLIMMTALNADLYSQNVGNSNEILFPSQNIDPVNLTSVQKGVGVSTDIIALGLPVATLAGVLISRDWEGVKQGVLTAAVTAGVTLILKFSISEQRPDKTNYHSFPSGHSATTFATAAFLQRRYGWKFGAPAYALATYTAIGRVVARKHHWWDVVAGAAIGVGSAYIFTKPWVRQHELVLAPVADATTVGFTASMTF